MQDERTRCADQIRETPSNLSSSVAVAPCTLKGAVPWQGAADACHGSPSWGGGERLWCGAACKGKCGLKLTVFTTPGI